ncbi:hypothetical protein FRC08_007070 [Ceratobasidium sp. 394]|nr:hypothetical protein FRC08_007070 [Ceratobasidium sp. 394]
MGQTSSQTAQDAAKPEISGPMPLSRARSPGRPRSYSGDAHRPSPRREHRRSRGPTGSSPTSPIVDSPSTPRLITSSIPEVSTPRSQSSGLSLQNRAARRRSSVTTTATAPPPYTAEPAGLDVQLAEAPPPPVPPRERDNITRRQSTHARPVEKPPIEWQDEPRHRRTVSHSMPGPSTRTSTTPLPATRTTSPPVVQVNLRRREMPPLISSSPPSAFGIGGFRAEMMGSPPNEEFSVAGGPPSIYSPHQSRANTQLAPAPRTRGTADYAFSPRAPPSRRGSREDPLEMLRRYKTVMIVDDSSSMEGESWAEARDALAGLADAAAKYDQDGIDVHFLNDSRVGTNMKVRLAITHSLNLTR